MAISPGRIRFTGSPSNARPKRPPYRRPSAPIGEGPPATAYLAENTDREALARAQDVIARGGVSAPQAHWTAGLAAYRLGQFDKAAQHFEAVLAGTNAQRTYSAAAFW